MPYSVDRVVSHFNWSRTHRWGRSMVLVTLTGWSQDDDRTKSAEAWFDHHVIKPVKTDALLRLLVAV